VPNIPRPANKSAAPAPNGSTMYMIGGYRYNAIVAPGCKVCHHHLRGRIEYWVALGYGWVDCVVNLPNNSMLNAQNIRDHFRKGHMPLQLAARRAISAQRSEELGIDIDKQGLLIKDSLVLLRSVVHQAAEDVLGGHVVVTLSDAIRAAASLAKIESEMESDDSLSMDEVTEGMRVFLATARATMTTGQWQEFSREIEINSFMRHLMGKDPLDTPPELEASVDDDYDDEETA